MQKLGGSLLAVATLAGTIIGVGMFGLPYAASNAGLLLALIYLTVLAGAVTLVHLIYGEVVLRTPEKHRLAGYAGVYFGSGGKAAASIIFFINLYLALWAYLLVGGEFLKNVLGGWIEISAGAGSLILAAIGLAVVFKGIRLTGFMELALAGVLVALIIGLTIYGANFWNAENLIKISSGPDLFLPYGVILFALAGGSAIPEIRSFFAARAGGYKPAIIWGTLIPAAIYGIFMVTVAGISGGNTSPEAIGGLTPILGRGFARYASLAGFLAVITSFFTLGLNIKNSFNLDFKLPHGLSFLLTAAVPLFLFFLGLADFIKVIALAGAVMGGLEGLLLLALWRRARKRGRREPEYRLKLPGVLVYLLVLMFAAGMVYEIIY